MANLVDVAPPLGIDLADDEAMLINATGAATVEGGVYSVDPASVLRDANGSYKYTTVLVVEPDELRSGMFVVARKPYISLETGMFVAHSQMKVRMSAENGQINPGDYLVPVPGKNYLVRATIGDMVSRRPIARASRPVISTLPTLEWCYFSGMGAFFGAADAAPGVVDEMAPVMTDRGIVIVDYTELTGGFVVSSAASMTFPHGRACRPRLQPGCKLAWEVEGIIARGNANAQVYRLEPVINGVVLPITIDHAPAGGAVGYPGIIKINTDMLCIPQDGTQGGTLYYRFDTRIRIYQNDDTLLSDTSVQKRSTVHPAAGSINPTIDNDISWRFSQNNAEATHSVWMENFWAAFRAFRTGV